MKDYGAILMYLVIITGIVIGMLITVTKLDKHVRDLIGRIDTPAQQTSDQR